MSPPSCHLDLLESVKLIYDSNHNPMSSKLKGKSFHWLQWALNQALSGQHLGTVTARRVTATVAFYFPAHPICSVCLQITFSYFNSKYWILTTVKIAYTTSF